MRHKLIRKVPNQKLLTASTSPQILIGNYHNCIVVCLGKVVNGISPYIVVDFFCSCGIIEEDNTQDNTEVKEVYYGRL